MGSRHKVLEDTTSKPVGVPLRTIIRHPPDPQYSLPVSNTTASRRPSPFKSTSAKLNAGVASAFAHERTAASRAAFGAASARDATKQPKARIRNDARQLSR